jgi:hypothetical protein
MFLAAGIFRGGATQSFFYQCANAWSVIFRMTPQTLLMIHGGLDGHDSVMARQYFCKCCWLRHIDDRCAFFLQLGADLAHHLGNRGISPMIEKAT